MEIEGERVSSNQNERTLGEGRCAQKLTRANIRKVKTRES